MNPCKIADLLPWGKCYLETTGFLAVYSGNFRLFSVISGYFPVIFRLFSASITWINFLKENIYSEKGKTFSLAFFWFWDNIANLLNRCISNILNLNHCTLWTNIGQSRICGWSSVFQIPCLDYLLACSCYQHHKLNKFHINFAVGVMIFDFNFSHSVYRLI